MRHGDTWTRQVKLTAGDRFGRSVAISGDYAIVGAPDDDDKGADSGSAYIFVRHGETWTRQARLTASDGLEGDRFGGSVAISGNYALVGASEGHEAYRWDDRGSAYIFVRDGDTWTQQVKLTASGVDAGDHFGSSVGISGVHAISGAPMDDDQGADSGSVYVFDVSFLLPEWNWKVRLPLLLNSTDRS